MNACESYLCTFHRVHGGVSLRSWAEYVCDEASWSTFHVRNILSTVQSGETVGLAKEGWLYSTIYFNVSFSMQLRHPVAHTTGYTTAMAKSFCVPTCLSSTGANPDEHFHEFPSILFAGEKMGDYGDPKHIKEWDTPLHRCRDGTQDKDKSFVLCTSQRRISRTPNTYQHIRTAVPPVFLRNLLVIVKERWHA